MTRKDYITFAKFHGDFIYSVYAETKTHPKDIIYLDRLLKNHLISKTLGTRIINSHLPKIEFIDYDEETIYSTFLEYCKWDKEKNTFTLKHDMESVCEIGEEIEITDNMTLNDKIQMLKEAGQNLNKNMLMVLMNNKLAY